MRGRWALTLGEEPKSGFRKLWFSKCENYFFKQQLQFYFVHDFIGGQTLDRNIFWEINFNAWPPISWIFKKVLFNLSLHEYETDMFTRMHEYIIDQIIQILPYMTHILWLILYDSLLTQKRMICENVWYNICTCITSDNIKNTIWTYQNVLLIQYRPKLVWPGLKIVR